MAGIRILNLPTATSPNSSDVFPIVNNNLTKQVSFFNAATSLGVLLTNTFVAPATAQTQTVSANVNNNGVAFSFNQFNPALGTLNSVTFAILSSVDSNYFSATNISNTSSVVKSPLDHLTVVDNQGSGAGYNGNDVPLVTTPVTVPVGYTLAKNSSQNFTITPVSLIGSNAVIADLSSYSNLYTGTGNVIFNVTINPVVTIKGGSVTLDMSTVTNTTTLQLTYTYTPVINPKSYILVPVSDNIITNGTNLLNAYQAATTLSPNASALSSTNRVVLILPPATYNLDLSSLKLNCEYIDIVGLTKDASHVTITSSNSAATIQQTANDVRCIGFTTSGWVPSNNLTKTYWENVAFSSISANNLSGIFKNCKSTNTIDGQGGFIKQGGIASGTFTDCIGVNLGMGGGGFVGSNGTAPGTFINCTGSNAGITGGGFVGGFGSASGTFLNCNGSNITDSGGGFGGISSNGSGYFYNCKGVCTGASFSGGFFGQNGVASGIFFSCIGSTSYGGSGGGFAGSYGTVSGTFLNCIGTGNGGNTIGGFGGYAATVTGLFINCSGAGAGGLGVSGNGINGSGANITGRFLSCLFTSDVTLPLLTNSGVSSKSACYINCLDGSGNLVNGSA
jgi:hypothetical protein